MSGRPWTEAEVDALIALVDGGATFVVAAQRLGRGMQAAKKKWASMSLEQIGMLDVVRPVVVPDECLVDRDRRSAAPHRTLVGACLGDPPVGFSALDRRSDASSGSRKVTLYEGASDGAPLHPPVSDADEPVSTPEWQDMTEDQREEA